MKQRRAARLSVNRRRSFGKGGRPAKDKVRERLRIYRSAGPLILVRGVRATTIGAIGRAACLSPGGVYHYFRSKTDLVLYGLEPGALSRACRNASAELARAAAARPAPHPHVFLSLYVDKSVEMIEFVRPALHAAVELGRSELRHRLSAGLAEDADALISSLRSLYPDLAAPAQAAETIRRATLGLALDESLSPADARPRLFWLLRRVVPAPGRRTPSTARALEA